MEASRVLLTPEAEEVTTRALTIPEQANAVKIVDAGSYVKAGELWNNIRELRKKVKDSFDPIIKKAHEAHREALDRKAAVDAPLDAAERTVKKAMNAWDEEQERIRREEERRLQEEARKREEEARLQAAIEAEQAGAKEEAEQILAEPVPVAPVIVPKATPKVAGGPVFQTRWFASVTDIKALCRAVADGKASTEYVMGLEKDRLTGIVSCPALNKMATALKGTMNVPGVQAMSRRV